MTSSLAQSIGPGHTPAEWAKAFLEGLGAPTTPENVDLIVSWENAESGGGGGAYNPLNSVLPTPGSGSLNSAGVQNYTSYEEGLKASIATFSQTQWAGVRNGLISDNQVQAESAIVSEYSSWDPTFSLSGTPPSGVANEQGVAGGGTGGTSSSSPGGCPEGNLFKGPSVPLIGSFSLTRCQGRALLGGVSLAGGAFLMVVGLGFVAIGGKSGRNLAILGAGSL